MLFTPDALTLESSDFCNNRGYKNIIRRILSVDDRMYWSVSNLAHTDEWGMSIVNRKGGDAFIGYNIWEEIFFSLTGPNLK